MFQISVIAVPVIQTNTVRAKYGYFFTESSWATWKLNGSHFETMFICDAVVSKAIRVADNWEYIQYISNQ